MKKLKDQEPELFISGKGKRANKSQVMTDLSATMADGRRGKADYLLLDQRGFWQYVHKLNFIEKYLGTMSLNC